jgi:Fic family protein
MGKSLIQRIREVAIESSDFDINGLTIALHIQSYEEKEKVRRAVKGLKRSNEVISIRPGYYRYKGKQVALSLIEKMWRAMRIKEHFTVRDIVRLTGASKTHAHKYFMFLEKKGVIVNSSGERGYRDGVYSLIDPDNAPLDHIRMPLRRRLHGEHDQPE